MTEQDRAPSPEHPDEPMAQDTSDSAQEATALTDFQKRIAAIPEPRWKLYQTLGGLLTGAIAVITLCLGHDGFSPLFVVAICLCLFLPNYLEKQGGRLVPRARAAMCIAIAIGLVVMLLVFGIQTDFTFQDP